MADFDPNDAYVLLTTPKSRPTSRVKSLTTGETFEISDQELAQITEIYVRPMASSDSE